MTTSTSEHNEQSPSKSAVLVTARDVHKNFRMGDSDVQVLKGLDLEVRSGEFLAIEGRSGSGKSTLLHILAGLDAADSGHVSFEGGNVSDLARSAAVARKKIRTSSSPALAVMFVTAPIQVMVIAAVMVARLIFHSKPDRQLSALRNRHFGFVFQFYHLLPELNVLENVLIGSMVKHSTSQWFSFKHPATERAKKLLEQLGLSHRLTHRPNQLSGGERQRVAIARALMNEPKILYADEPTGNLDYETGLQIMSVLNDLHSKGQTIVMVTHDRSLAKQADRALILREGKLVQG